MDELKTHFLLDIQELQHVVMALLGVHVVGKHKGELLAVGPALPPLGLYGRSGIDGPDVAVLLFDNPCAFTAKEQLQMPRDYRLNCVE